MFNSYTYCFLQAVLIDSNNTIKAFRTICSDAQFQNFAYYITSVNGLVNLCGNSDLIKDFEIKDGFLKCDEVPRVIFTSEDLAVMDTIIPFGESHLLEDFIFWGANNGCLVLEDTEATMYSNFRDIEVAQSTMSIYVKMVNQNLEIHNKMLVIMDGLEIKCNTFITAVPKDICLPVWLDGTEYKDVGQMCTIHNKEYYLIEVHMNNVGATNLVRASAYINKACALHVKYKSIIDVLQELKNTLYISQGFQLNEGKYSWNGGSKSYKDSYGVFFKSSIKSLGSADKFELIGKLTELMTECSSLEEIREQANEYAKNMISKLAINALIDVMYSAVATTDVIHNCIETINNCKIQQLAVDLLLYKIRAGAYENKIMLAPCHNPVLLGSDESCYTVVEEVLEI